MATNLDLIDGGSDYGAIQMDGVYNVCDYAEETWVMNGITRYSKSKLESRI